MLNTVIFIVAIVVVLVVVSVVNNRGIAQVTPAAAQETIKSSGALVLDVRTPEEFSGGHIKGAKLIPVGELNGRIDELASAKARAILVYCHAGSRSAAASRILRKNGFVKVINLRGGISAWNGAGYPTVKGN